MHQSQSQSSHAQSGTPASSAALRNSDSWIDLASQQSSSSASSLHDEVITHGLRVQSSTLQPRRPARRGLSLKVDRPASATGSSQDEYEESESESDQVMTSSNEAPPLRRLSSLAAGTPLPPGDDAGEDADEDDDENATALGIGSNDHGVFTPQPNAFSHPPSSEQQSAGSYFPSARPSTSRSTSHRFSHSSPPKPADHDAALRASLTTLLSCAAAVRGLPKAKDGFAPPSVPVKPQSSARVEPTTLRMIPAAELNRRRSSDSSSAQHHSSTSPSPSRASSISDKHKRKASRSGSKERRAVKRLRAVGVDEAISPTLLTWVVSAGVLVLVSALSFSAGYSAGRSAGRAESGFYTAGAAGDCGRQSRAGLGLRRRLLGEAAQVVTA